MNLPKRSVPRTYYVFMSEGAGLRVTTATGVKRASLIVITGVLGRKERTPGFPTNRRTS